MRNLLFLLLALLLCGGCNKRSTPRQASSPNPTAAGMIKIDASKLLTSEEIQSVLGEPLKEPVAATRSEAGFAISQCYFTLPTPSNSAVLTVTSRGNGNQAQDPRQFWMEKFHPSQDEDAKKRQEEERKPVPPEKVDGVGDEAYWVESGSTGALYVLQANNFIRVAIGGTDEKPARINKTKKLAQFALERLPLR
jgi:hypothetical protein